MKYFIYGFLMHIAQIMAIGPQNIFVLTNSRGNLLIPLTCILLDALLIGIMSFGVIKTIAQNNYILQLIQFCGSAFLFKYAFLSMKRAWQNFDSMSRDDLASRKSLILNAICVSILNAGSWIDTIAISTIGMKYENIAQVEFYLGNIAASLAWFSLLGCLGYLCSKLLSSKKTWRYINFATGIIMIIMAFRLLFN